MSYTAIGSGSITLNAVSAEEQKNLQEALLTRYDRLRTADLAQCGDDMAYQIEREYLELLNTLVPFTAEGFISYRGEKGDLWCHVFAGGEWTERSGRICYDEPRPQFEESKQNLARLIEEIRRQVIYDDRPYEDRARDLLKAFEAHDPDGVLLALSGRRLREHGVAAAIWQDGGESAHPDEGE